MILCILYSLVLTVDNSNTLGTHSQRERERGRERERERKREKERERERERERSKHLIFFFTPMLTTKCHLNANTWKLAQEN